MSKEKCCKDCKSNIVGYADGFILKDFTTYQGDTSKLPIVPDESKFWVYRDCKKNTKKLQFVNLMNNCSGFELKK